MAVEVGRILEGKVTGITNFGAFVELEEGKSGMVHISEVAPVYVEKISDFLEEGQTVKVKLNIQHKTIFFISEILPIIASASCSWSSLLYISSS